jgi:trimeric autotransporter adhesin
MSRAYRISLNGAQQVPGVVTIASGLGTAIFDSVTSSMSIVINIQGLDWGPLLGQASQTPDTADDVTGVHIHNAARGVNGDIVLDWPGGGDADDFVVSGVLADGSRILTSNWETTDADPITDFTATLASATLGADVPFYVNIHTVANGGGEIRGQLECIATDNGETVNGTSGNDFLPGLGGDDRLIGGDGDDVLDGGAGGDFMYGGLGNDTYFVADAGDTVAENGGEGIDTVYASRDLNISGGIENLILLGSAVLGWGSEDANVITGNAGGNNLNGRGGDDILIGAAGNDILNGWTGDDVVMGGDGSDLLDGGEGDDVLIGGAGGDQYFLDSAADTMIENAGEGGDVILTAMHFRLPANVEGLTLRGVDDLQGYGNELDNSIRGTSGNNLLDGGAGADTMVGLTGDDTYFVDNVGDYVGESDSADQGIDTIFASISLNLGFPFNQRGVENLVLQGDADLQGFGNALANSLYGNSGNNILDGDTGADAMVGGAGNDTYFVDNAGDQVFENASEGNDTVTSRAHHRLSANVETLVLQGGDLQGYGNSLVNSLTGSSGNNLLDGDVGADLMAGGAGNDTYVVDDALDMVVENASQGNDAVLSSAHYGLSANVEALVLQGSADLQGYGNGLANTLHGNTGNNLINGAGGADTMYGGIGNDTYFVDNGLDQVVENPGEGTDAVFSSVHFILSANMETLVLQGGANANGTGNELANSVFGNSGDNTLDGQGAADVLTGDAGNDTFVFHAGQADGDTVVDFAGNGALAGDSLRLIGYGLGATFTTIDATYWQVNYNGGASHEIIAFQNGAAVNASDVVFV